MRKRRLNLIHLGLGNQTGSFAELDARENVPLGGLYPVLFVGVRAKRASVCARACARARCAAFKEVAGRWHRPVLCPRLPLRVAESLPFRPLPMGGSQCMLYGAGTCSVHVTVSRCRSCKSRTEPRVPRRHLHQQPASRRSVGQLGLSARLLLIHSFWATLAI
jgi:hypothetical protein